MPEINQVIEAYIKLRDARDAMKKKHTQELRPILDNMEKLEGWLHRKLNADNLKNFSGQAGTAFLKKRTSVKVMDRDVYFQFVRDRNAWSFLEARANPTEVQEFMDEHGAPPPGVDVTVEEVCQVRR